ncbi:hypothetical protein ACR6C2_26020 [Streptomyces sp. INA 01156]
MAIDANGQYGEDPLREALPGREKSGPLMPWNIGGPQPAVRTICDHGGFRGHVLDLGCGLGTTRCTWLPRDSRSPRSTSRRSPSSAVATRPVPTA